jgi:hypothetical protein
MSTEMRSDSQFDRFILRYNGPQLVALAQWGYQQHGRGAVLIGLSVEPKPGHTMVRYLPAAYLRERIHGSTNAHEHQRFLADVATYDPAQTLLIVVERQGAWHPYRIEIAALALAQSRPAQVSAA